MPKVLEPQKTASTIVDTRRVNCCDGLITMGKSWRTICIRGLGASPNEIGVFIGCGGLDALDCFSVLSKLKTNTFIPKLGDF